jgi:hypothetical protein
MSLLSRRHAILGLAAFGALTRPTALLAQGMPAANAAGTLADLRRRGPGSGDMPIYLQGALTAGDDGGGWFVWRAASQAPDDGGCVLAPDPDKPGRWHRLFSGAVDARWFGARGDGLADDIEPLQRAIAHHAEIHLPAGVYRLSRPLDMTESWGRRLTGAGQTADVASPGGFENGRLSRASTLLLDADDAPVLRLAGSGHVIERLCLMAKTRQPRAAEKSYGIEINNVSRSRLSDLRIFNCATGIGIPQRPASGDAQANWLFDTTIANVDINAFARCGLDLRNYEGGGTGVVLSQIYLSNMAGGTLQAPQLLESEHFILGRNWGDYVLQAVHCEWTRCRDIPIRLHNATVAMSGLHFEGVRFAEDVEAIIRIEGGYGGITIDAAQIYDCRIEGGPSAAPLPLLSATAKIARARLSAIRFADTLTSPAGRRITAARLASSDSKVDIFGLIQESKAYAPPTLARGLTVRD